ncbi:MAG: alpha/beta hydrolase [Cupriavidus sp.]|uniref:alpha/beta fold hydrolase n=2 Tax=Cupriavidus pauculus TaxID=82633 RepID=UPI000C51D52D|nr:alpha/beta fold hydrolase [Cupriavidus pauculus]MBU68349.1 alpha/beta hydrolase [Cupriavidus sp.]KAB0601236.1 alpha/beta fold hydrolase [Cupriavidus pauculus]MBY4729668.1 alpha/beta fold hydrolase [Cupriavidus pauculus]MCM3606885.1 alpha/beta fold hydrolase [Cupriavidus pauculus]UAK99091.1 alpha/beta fold hydrolase [Cupriavidus pauculus]
MNVLLVLVLAVAAAGAALLALLFVFTWRTTRKIEAALPPTGRFVDVPGARLHVVERGNGPAVLLVHGLSGQLANFDYGMIEPLSRDFRVIAVDRPGAGYSTRQPGAAADLRAQADTLAALIDQLGLHKPLVVGHSLGGAISLALATYHPDRVGGLALIAPLTHPPEAVSPVFRAMAVQSAFVRKLIAWTLVIPMSIRRREQVMNIVFGPDAVPADFPTRGGGLLALRPSHFIGASEDLLGVAHSLPPLLPRYSDLRVPVSILFGREDRILDYRMNGEAFVAKLPAARLTLVNGGHMLPVTAVQTSVDFVRDAALQLHEAVAA